MVYNRQTEVGEMKHMKLKTRRLLRKLTFKLDYKTVMGRTNITKYCRQFLHREVARINKEIAETGATNVRVGWGKNKQSSKK